MEILHLTKNDFDSTISTGTVLVDFWAIWCMPCKLLASVINEIAEELDDSIKVAKVDVDAEGELALLYGVMSIPTVILFKDGQEVKRFVGVQPKDVYMEALTHEKTAVSAPASIDSNTGTDAPDPEAVNEGIVE